MSTPLQEKQSDEGKKYRIKEKKSRAKVFETIPYGKEKRGMETHLVKNED